MFHFHVSPCKKNNVRRSSMLTTKAEKGQTLNSVSWMTVEGWIGGAMAMLVIGLVYPISNYFLNLYINVLKSSNKAY